MKRIIDSDLLKWTQEGIEQKEIAERFGVSAPAVCKRLKRLNQFAARPAILDKLTAKEEKFVMAIAEGKTQGQAALSAFNVNSLDSAKTIGCRLAKDPQIQEAISAVMESVGLDRRYLVGKLKGHVEGIDPNVSLRAVDMGLKLTDSYPAIKNVNINLNADIHPVDLSRYRSAN